MISKIRRANDNRISVRQGHILRRKAPVWIYRLKTGRYSLAQGGRVVARASRLCLSDVTFRIREDGRHVIVGTIADSGMGTTAKGTDLPVKVKYPGKLPYFYHELCIKPQKLNGLWFAVLNEHGVFGAYSE